MRLGNRLRIETDLAPDARRHRGPFSRFNRFVENAIRHAVATRARGDAGQITARVDTPGRLRLEVSDDRPGADPVVLASRRGRGLRAMRQRREVCHGNAAALEISTYPDKGFRAVAFLPASP